MAILDVVLKQIRDLQREQREPTEIQLGAEDYYELVAANDERTKYTLSMDFGKSGLMHLYGLPIRKLPVSRAVIVI